MFSGNWTSSNIHGACYWRKVIDDAKSAYLSLAEVPKSSIKTNRSVFLVFKNLLMPLFLMGCFPVSFQEAKRPLTTKSGKCPIKVGKRRPIKEEKRPIKAMVLVGSSVGCLMGCFRAPPPWRKTAPLKRPTKRSMNYAEKTSSRHFPECVVQLFFSHFWAQNLA